MAQRPAGPGGSGTPADALRLSFVTVAPEKFAAGVATVARIVEEPQ